jgi:hypothetical protein
MGPAPGFSEMFGYSEPLRRFIQREGFEPQANEIPNTMPSWMPGDDYYTNFHKGDPFIKVDQGFARLPGKGYEALHPELEGTNPEDYPDINKMAILADVAPYSREYNNYRLRVGKESKGNTELQIEYEKILDRVRQTRVFRPLPLHGTIENHYRLRQLLFIYLSIYELLALHRFGPRFPAFRPFAAGRSHGIEKLRHKLRHPVPALFQPRSGPLSKLRHRPWLRYGSCLWCSCRQRCLSLLLRARLLMVPICSSAA